MKVLYPLLSLVFLSTLTAQELPGDKSIYQYLKTRTEGISKNYLRGATTREEWEKKLPKLREEYLEMLGLWPLPEKTPLKAKVTRTQALGEVTIENLHYQSSLGLYVTGNLYRPTKQTGKLPGILYVCGHSNRGRDGNKTAFADHGMWFASNGYVCLIVDTLQLGEVAGKHHGTYNLNRFWWQARGYTSAGIECWNGIRGIDYLCSRPEVDAEKIGVTGISGGGAATVWIAAADDRVKVAVPVSGMSDLESYISNRVINGHCDCMFMINTYSWEWTTIAALIAPRPLLFANSDNDGIFPMDGNRRIIERLRSVYAMYNKPDVVDDHVSKGGHDYRPDLRLAIFRFFDKHLKVVKRDIEDAVAPRIAGRELRAFPEDSDLPMDSKNAVIDEEFVPLAKVALPEKTTAEAWRTKLLESLRNKGFRDLPLKSAKAEVVGEPVGTVQNLTTESGLEFQIISLVPAKADTTKGTLLILNPDEPILEVTRGWAKEFIDERAVIAILPRGGIPSKWTRKNPPNYVERACALLGTTVDTGRVKDIIGTAKLFDDLNQGKIAWRVVGRGQAGVLGAYAALLDSTIKEVVIVDPVTSHRDGPYFLNVLRVLDVPEALGLLAPRPLTLLNSKDKAFDRTAEIYKLFGAEKKLQRE